MSKKISRNMLLKQVKEANQDFNWYPTKNSMIDAMYWDIKKTFNNDGRIYKDKYEYQSISFLDIGAGDGKVYSRMKELSNENVSYDGFGNILRHNMIGFEKYMVIEKSEILLNALPPEVFIAATDFHDSFLVDKPCDIIFSNPPFDDYLNWMNRIIKEATAKQIYFIVPKRFAKNQSLKKTLRDRKARVKIIENFTFLDSEDRKARAFVSLVRVDLIPRVKRKINGKNTYSEGIATDPFDTWIDETFKFSSCSEEKKVDEWEQKRNQKDDLKSKLVGAIDLVAALIKLYNQEIDVLFKNYMKVSELDPTILKELNVDVKNLKSGLKQKIVGLKHRYWLEIFDNLGDIKKRLIKRSRDTLVNKLNSQTNIDFTASNVRAVVIWVIKNANSYYDSQILQVYDDFTTEEGITLYKSNQKFNKDDFRYLKREKKLEKYTLDYRIVRHGYFSDYDKKYNTTLSGEQEGSYLDIIVIGQNLGFKIEKETDFSLFQRNEKYNIYMTTPKGRVLKVGTKDINGSVIKEVFFHTTTKNENKERVMKKDGITYVYSKDSSNEYQYLLDDGSYCHPNIFKIQSDVFMTVKGFQNGNMHYQLNKNFIKALNLEVGRQRGWLKDPAHAAAEFDITKEEAANFWDCNFKISAKDMTNLLPKFDATKKIEKSTSICPQCEQEDILNESGLCSVCQDMNDAYDKENIVDDLRFDEEEVVIDATLTIEPTNKKEETEYITVADGSVYIQGSLF